MKAGDFYREVGNNSTEEDEVVVVQDVEGVRWEYPITQVERMVNPDGSAVLVVRVGDPL